MDAKVIEEASVLVEELPLMDDLEVLSLCRGEDFCGEDYCIDFSSMGGSREAGGASSDADGSEEAVDGRSGDGDGFSAERVKMEEDSLEYGKAMKIEVDEMLASEWNGWREEEVKQKICLQLNYEDVLSAWSDRGPLWADDTCPQIVPYHSSYEAADALATARDHSGYLNTGLVPDFSFYSGSSTTGGAASASTCGEF
ncbi:hypothetical protein O6H91_20G075400 [Diphasiastrum complanatum]|uniref:Uncharacterized protein n=1 Tax=Diphasiastrum complanatum TaxID=34168 RepID=A0ACC2ARV2_DIPCM|nr:hypothetical protein O6H91_20G075400 [Diphasiastrum complanatum]